MTQVIRLGIIAITTSQSSGLKKKMATILGIIIKISNSIQKVDQSLGQWDQILPIS